MQGFNCSQSVVAAFADIYGYTEEQALRMSAGFGGGIGRLRLSCGAFNASPIIIKWYRNWQHASRKSTAV